MASTFTSTKETTNYARLCRLLVDVGTQVLRDKFDKMYTVSLHTFLASPSVRAALKSLQKKRVLHSTQMAKLALSTVSSADFDITLLVLLLRNVCGLSPPPTTGWNNPPLPTDMTEEADIVRLRIHRNEVYAHTNAASVDDLTFSKYWVSIKEPLIRIGGPHYQSIIDGLETECMDPEKEQHYQKLLKEWKENEECVMETLGSIKESLDATENKLQKMDEKLDTLVKPVADPVEDVNVEDFSAPLSALYNNLSQVKITPWDADNTVHIDEIYTQLCWLRDDKRPSGIKQEKLADYSDMFEGKMGKPNPNRILVYGRPGIGKSAFSQKISIDWARGKKEILKNFDLLLMIPLRNVCDSETFCNMLQSAKLFSIEDQKLIDSLHSYIIQHKDKVLLVLDGFDEYSAGTASPVFEIWKGNELRECVVILTTRPIKGDEVKRFSDVQFQIKGFDSAQIKEFSMKFLDDEQEVELFLSYVKTHKLEEIAEIPLLLLMLCLVWKERDREGLPESRVYLYSDFIQALCNHMASKDLNGEMKSIKDYNSELAHVGELAFNALLENSLEFDFEHLPDELLNSRLIRVGIIQIVKLFSAKPKKVVAFLHKSIQEFLAAWFVIHKLIPSSTISLSCMSAIDSTDKVVAMVEVLKFVCEWSLDGAIAVLQHLESLRKKESPSEHHISKALFLEDLSEDEKKLRELNLECFMEAPASAKAEVYPLLLNSVGGVLVIPDTMLHLIADDHVVKSKVPPNHVLFNFRRRLSQKQRDCMASIMDDLNAKIVTASGESKASDFVRKQSKFEVLATLFLKRTENKIYLHFSEVSGIDVRTLNELTLPELNVLPHSSTDQQQGNETATEMSFQSRQHCFSLAKKIDIDEIEHDDLSNVISNVVPLVYSPHEITIRGSQEVSAPHEMQRLVSGMKITDCLQRLRLHRINLTAHSLASLADAFDQAINLQELFLSENPLGSGVSFLAENFRHMQQLTSLELTEVAMEEQAFSDLANSLCHVPQLKVLSVSRNKLGPSITVLAENLDNVSCLTHLELSRTEMDEEGATALSDSLRSLSKLEVLDVSHNPLGSAVTVIAGNLRSTPCLTELYMTDTKMGCDEVTAVATSLKYLQNLRMASVGSNPLGQGVCALIQNLSKVPKLKHLNLASVQMGQEEVNVVSKAYKRTQSVTIATDYHDDKGMPLPAKTKNSPSSSSEISMIDEWDNNSYSEDLDNEDDEDYDDPDDNYRDYSDEENDHNGDDDDDNDDDDDYDDYDDDDHAVYYDEMDDNEDDENDDTDNYPDYSDQENDHDDDDDHDNDDDDDDRAAYCDEMDDNEYDENDDTDDDSDDD